jgi:succinate dehydrogenase/fumarate reductase iron-sulfur protein
MADYYKVTVRRYSAGHEPPNWEQAYLVPAEDRTTILQALQYIYENVDPLLAFEYSCRYGRCGLCGLEVNGKPVLACMAFISKEENLLAPLSNLERLRDLIIDRKPIERLIRKFGIYHGEAVEQVHQAKSIPEPGGGFKNINVPDHLSKLMECVNCLCCHASCPMLKELNHDLERFAGPYIFLKLASLQFDPGDNQDRLAQAHKLGLKYCADCRKCYCPQGVPIYSGAIKPLLEWRQ